MKGFLLLLFFCLKQPHCICHLNHCLSCMPDFASLCDFIFSFRFFQGYLLFDYHLFVGLIITAFVIFMAFYTNFSQMIKDSTINTIFFCCAILPMVGPSSVVRSNGSYFVLLFCLPIVVLPLLVEVYLAISVLTVINYINRLTFIPVLIRFLLILYAYFHVYGNFQSFVRS